MYLIVICYGCGQFVLAKSTQKTRRCPHCEIRLKLTKVKKVAHLKTVQEASIYLRELKRKRNC